MGEILRFPVQQSERASQSPEAPEPLWRELVGRELLRERRQRGERQVDVAERPGVS